MNMYICVRVECNCGGHVREDEVVYPTPMYFTLTRAPSFSGSFLLYLIILVISDCTMGEEGRVEGEEDEEKEKRGDRRE